MALFLVNSTSDGTVDDEFLTLREAVEAANADPGLDIINFELGTEPATIVLDGEQLTIINDVVIDTDDQDITVDADQRSRVFEVDGEGVDAVFNGLTITGGRTAGADGDGAGIFGGSGTDLTFLDSSIRGNNAYGGGSSEAAAIGGGIAGFDVTVANSIVSNNYAGGGYDYFYTGQGGGIFAYRVDVSGSEISNNTAGGLGFGSGGGIYASIAYISGSEISNNLVGGGTSAGAGVDANVMTLVSSNIHSNKGYAGDFAVYGGGLSGGTVTLVSSAVSGNYARGYGSIGSGVFANEVTLINSTVNNNSLTSFNNNGGGIAADQATLINSTVSGNTSLGYVAQGGYAVSVPGGIVGDVRLANSIVSGNVRIDQDTGAAEYDDISGAIDQTASIVGGDPQAIFAETAELIPGSGLYGGVLAANGGPTPTIALASGGPAVDAGDNDEAVDQNGDPLEFDQRGDLRIVNGTVDLGAFEVQGSPATSQPVAEWGQLLALTDTPQTVSLSESFTDPIVFVGPLSFNGNQVAVARLTEVTSDSFTVFAQEANYLDGSHVAEELGYLVVERGSWELADGTRLEADTLDTDLLSSEGFETVAFDTDFTMAPTVLSQVQTFNGPDFVDTRQRNPSTDGVEITMQEEEALNGGFHTTETIGVLAIEPGVGSSDVGDFEAGTTAAVFDDGVNPLDFTADFTDTPDTPTFLASIASFRGSDPVFPRVLGLDAGSAQITLQEDQSADAEGHHLDEQLSFFALEGADGTLFGADMMIT